MVGDVLTTTKDILVSVIVPVYMAEEYLPRCFDSILSQTHRNLQIILVDDGSPGESGAICDEYAKKDSRIQVIHKANGGPGAARNTGLDAAKGDWIGFVDCDDWIDSSMYETLLNTALDNCADIAVCGIGSFGEDGNTRERTFVPPSVNNAKSDELLIGLLSGYSNLTNGILNKLYRRELITLAKLRFDETVTGIEDLLFNIELFIFLSRSKKGIGAKNVHASQAELYHYFSRKGSVTRSFNYSLASRYMSACRKVITLTEFYSEELSEEAVINAKFLYIWCLTICLSQFARIHVKDYNRELRKEMLLYAPIYLRSGQISLYAKLKRIFLFLLPRTACRVFALTRLRT